MHKIVTGHAPSSSPGRVKAPPATLVVFGAGGDLTRRLLVPSIYNLSEAGLLDEGFSVLGVDRSPDAEPAWLDGLDGTLRAFVGDASAEFHPDRIDEEAWSWLTRRARFLRADFTEPATFEEVARRVGEGSALFYLAVPARFFAAIAKGLADAGLMREGPGRFRRLVVEKPFGEDLASARALNAALLARMREEQVFRIDHFMGKEAVQSLLAMRFGNAMFEPFWDRRTVAQVEITAAETLGVEGRGRFYEPTGAVRDMVPNHLFQLLCMTAMDAPSSLAAEAIRDEKSRLLRAVEPLRPEDVVLGQYAAGGAMPAYRDEPDVAPDSATETYAALRLSVRNWRWAGVPFVLRTGKRMTKRRTEIVLRLRPPPFALFPGAPDEGADDGAHGAVATSDRIVIGIDPHQDVEIAFDVKRPGPSMQLADATARFDFADLGEPPNVGYEVLIYDALLGDATLFQRADAIEAAWAVVDPILSGHEGRPAPRSYAAGTDGPDAASTLAPLGWSSLEPADGAPLRSAR